MAPLSNDFPETRWTIIRLSRDSDPRMAGEALESLCREYRAPILAFIERSGVNKSEAEDLVQDFLLKFIRNGGFTKVKNESGRARSYILKSVQYFLIDRHRSENAEKRSRANTFTLEEESIDGAVHPVFAIFDRKWAQSIMDKALEKVQEFFTAQDKETFGKALYGIIEGRNDTLEKRKTICDTFEITENHLAVATTRFQKRLKKEIRGLVSKTVSNPEEVEDELRYLRNVMAATMKAESSSRLSVTD